VLAFSAVSVLFLFFFQLVQGKLPLHLNNPATPMTHRWPGTPRSAS